MRIRNRKKIIFFWIAGLMLASGLLFSPTQPIRAQQPQTIQTEETPTGLIHGVVPAQGRASGTIQASCDELCWSRVCPTDPVKYPYTNAVAVEFWNVGKLGGEQYKWIKITLTPVGDKPDCLLGLEYWSSSEYFAGGPNGSVTPTAPWATEFKMDLVNGLAFNLTIGDFSASIPVENPEIFDGWTDEDIEAPPPEPTEEAIEIPLPEPTEEVIVPLLPESTDEVPVIPAPITVADCLNDPLNALDCMGAPFVRQGLTAVIGVGATLLTILVTMLGVPAAAAGESAGAAAGAELGQASPGAVASVAVGAATALGGSAPQAITGAASGQAPSPGPAKPPGQAPSPGQTAPPAGRMTQAEYRQLVSQVNALTDRAHQLNQEEQEWRIEERRIYDLLQRGITNYQSNASKVVFGFGKDVLEWTPLTPVGPQQVVGKAVEKISGKVAEILTKPPSKGATDAEILEHLRETNRLLEEKLAEAKKMRADLHRQKQAVLQQIAEINQRIQDNPVLTLY
jgi:hypothetical protein